jgi:methyl-accepting chemotaxis protein
VEQRRKQKWWNSLGFESDFKKQQLVRVLAFAAFYVALSTFAMSIAYGWVIKPLSVGELPFYMSPEQLRHGGSIPGMTQMLTVWATLMTGMSVMFACVVGMYFSHKLAGPIYRFKLELQRIVDGHGYREIRLRDGDDFHDVAHALNRALDQVSHRETVLRESLRQKTDALEAVVEAVRTHGSGITELRDAVAKLEADGSSS